HYLTIDDVVLAFRPGRSAAEVVAILASLTERNRIAARDGDSDDDESDGSSNGSKASKQKPGKASHDTPASGQDSSSGGWRRDKPSGAEVIQPEP
ncbi:AAA family ATPase, partial [Rhizobium sp. AQ_MP]|nr:AAA family ATPase [Rhizobium sp. AQ_MP]